MTAPMCKAGDEIEILNSDTGEWSRHKIDRLEYVPPDRHFCDGWDAFLDDGTHYWVELNGTTTKWRRAQASTPVTGVCS